MQLGLIIDLTDNPEGDFQKVFDLGFSTCQLNCWQGSLFTEALGQIVVAASKKFSVRVTALWCGWEGPAVWDFVNGPLTLGLLPEAYRFARLNTLIQGAKFAKQIGVPDLITHVGFIPEDPNTNEYRSLISALRYLAQKCYDLNINFLFETGQETPTTLLRTIEDLGMPNIGVNLDPANLILYGKGNPIDAMDVLGKYIRGVHAKDGLFPNSGRKLGIEVPIGSGRVDFPNLINQLKEYGYDGAVTIEREITGPKQIEDIIAAKKYLEKIIAQV